MHICALIVTCIVHLIEMGCYSIIPTRFEIDLVLKVVRWVEFAKLRKIVPCSVFKRTTCPLLQYLLDCMTITKNRAGSTYSKRKINRMTIHNKWRQRLMRGGVSTTKRFQHRNVKNWMNSTTFRQVKSVSYLANASNNWEGPIKSFTQFMAMTSSDSRLAVWL